MKCNGRDMTDSGRRNATYEGDGDLCDGGNGEASKEDGRRLIFIDVLTGCTCVYSYSEIAPVRYVTNICIR